MERRWGIRGVLLSSGVFPLLTTEKIQRIYQTRWSSEEIYRNTPRFLSFILSPRTNSRRSIRLEIGIPTKFFLKNLKNNNLKSTLFVDYKDWTPKKNWSQWKGSLKIFVIPNWSQYWISSCVFHRDFSTFIQECSKSWWSFYWVSFISKEFTWCWV